jgi:uncharacterized Zn finger protein
MSIPKLSEAILHQKANAKSFERGETYYQTGAVVDLTQRGNTLQAKVEGSAAEPYHVRLTFDEGGLTSAQCNCAYSFEGWCKHIVATVLVCLHQPERIEQRPTLEHLLDRLDHLQTRRLVQALVAEQPSLIEAVDRHVSLMAEPTLPQPTLPQQSVTSPRRTTVDPAPFRHEVHQILRNAVHGWESGWDEDSINEDLQVLIAKAQDFTEHGDGNNALVVLGAITNACVDYWDEVADYGTESYDVVASLDKAWTEAILSTELTPLEKTALQEHLEGWQDTLDGTFTMSLEALRQGWDYPPLQQVLQGHITPLGAWDREAPDYADELALIRLKILDRQERHQEYLHLAEAESQTEHYLTMLARLGQVEAVMEAAKTQLASPEAAFALARVLREKGALKQALDIAQAGLNLPGQAHLPYDLAVWASDLAEGLNDRRSALAARITAFKLRPSLGDYQKAAELAGEAWSTMQAELLTTLRNHQLWGSEQAKVDIFLQEGLIDNAITAVKNLSDYQSELVKRVMTAALTQRPDWVIKNACHRAEEIMDAGKADAYYHAIEWLRQARAAYLASERQSEWQAYRAKLMQIHARKYKLMGMLKQQDLV